MFQKIAYFYTKLDFRFMNQIVLIFKAKDISTSAKLKSKTLFKAIQSSFDTYNPFKPFV